MRALPIEYTSRFNDICWCQGGVGYGWWPACIFNPCLAIGVARTLATKNLGRRHLVYFFYCAEAPFEIKSDSAILSWEMGIAMGYHMGRTAHGHGKRRFKQFQLAVSYTLVAKCCMKNCVSYNKSCVKATSSVDRRKRTKAASPQMDLYERTRTHRSGP